VPIGTIMSRLARGREKLRRLMDGEDPELKAGKTP
jgi:DNA-directed RNA polymerase specialized sigma24 family protein